jgi:hypothetical protein
MQQLYISKYCTTIGQDIHTYLDNYEIDYDDN